MVSEQTQDDAWELDLASIVRPLPGEIVAGDAAFTERRGDSLHLGLVDGLGHGPLAAAAASAVCKALAWSSWDNLVDLMHACDHAARGTRGAAVALVRIHCHSGVSEHVAVGNVEVVVASAHEQRFTPQPQGGVVGEGIRRLRVTTWTLQRRDRLIMFTDGISRRFDPVALGGANARESARALIERHGKQHDDASCIVLHA